VNNKITGTSTPIKVIAYMFGICELAIVYGSTKLIGAQQWALIIFAIVFPILIGIAFFIILWKKPYNFYPPSEYGDSVKPQEFVGALQKDETKTKYLLQIENSNELIESIEILDIEDKPIENDDIQPEKNWRFYADEGDYIKARELILKNLDEEINENEKSIWITRSAIILTFLDFPTSEKEFPNLIRKFPNHYPTYYWYSRIYMKTKQYSKALNILDEAIKILPENNDILLEKALIYIEIDELPKARELLEKIIHEKKYTSQVARAYQQIGSIYQKTDDIDNAKANYLNAYKTMPSDQSNISSIAQFFNEIKAYKEELFFRKLNVKINENVSSWGLLGNCYSNNGLFNKAMFAYNQAEKIKKGSWIQSNIGSLFNHVGLYNEANEYLNNALKTDPESKFIHDRLSDVIENLSVEDKKEEGIISIVKL